MLTAISYGVASVEADVWLVNGTLFVSPSNLHRDVLYITDCWSERSDTRLLRCWKIEL